MFAGRSEGPEFAYALGNAVLYAGLGLYFMYFYREIMLNLVLAQSRAERGKLEGSQEAERVVQRFQLRLPASVLTGVEDIDEVQNMGDDEVQHLKELLHSDEVKHFLLQADEAAQRGTADWDVVSKTAYIYYYRTFFEKENKNRAVARATEWLIRALNMNPLHSDLSVLYAEMLGAKNEFGPACAVLERLALRNEAPMYVLQWLGYYMRFLPDRLDDAIRYSDRYHGLFPEETYSLFNIAYAYARKYGLELQSLNQAENLTSENRSKALSALARALKDYPKMRETIATEWVKQGGGMEFMLRDSDFCGLLGASNTGGRDEPQTRG